MTADAPEPQRHLIVGADALQVAHADGFTWKEEDAPPPDWLTAAAEPATDQGAQGDEPITLRPAVADFALAIEKRLRLNDHKAQWSDLKMGQIDDLLKEEVQELLEACSRSEILHESEDVAVCALIYWTRGYYVDRGRIRL